MEFILVSLREFLGKLLLYLLVGHFVANAGVDLVQGFPLFLRGVDERGRLLRPLQMRRPNFQIGKILVGHEITQGFRVTPAAIRQIRIAAYSLS